MLTDLALKGCALAAQHAFGPDADPRRLDEAQDYLAHTVAGIPMRDLARRRGVHASTVLRCVRRLENRRDDPLHDALLTEAEAALEAHGGAEAYALTKDKAAIMTEEFDAVGTEADLEKEARRILRRLGEPRAFLAIARGAETACVFRPGPEGPVVLAKLSARSARDFLGRDWIVCTARGRSMAKYELSEPGRAWLKRILHADGERRGRAARSRSAEPAGMAEAAGVFARQHQEEGLRPILGEDGVERPTRVNLGETPLGWLARRKGPDGKPFLTAEEVVAGERLREDFERAQLGPKVGQDWSRFLAPVDVSGGGPSRLPVDGPTRARDRLGAAMAALGPGLNDVALRSCCFLEGLEATERRMGWAARSGKVVLKIALGRLADHYGLTARPAEAGMEEAR